MSLKIELQVYDKVFSFRKVHGEWEAEQAITGSTMTPIFDAALTQIEDFEQTVKNIKSAAERRSDMTYRERMLEIIRICNHSQRKG